MKKIRNSAKNTFKGQNDYYLYTWGNDSFYYFKLLCKYTRKEYYDKAG